jgi:hypothetical protein
MSSNSTLQKKNVARVVIITMALLSLPLLAIVLDWRFIDPGNPIPERVNWHVIDFIVMAFLIFGMGMMYKCLALKVTGGVNRFILAIALLGVFVLIWAELAVGIFGSPLAGS